MGLWRPTPGSLRAARDREVRYLRQQGRYGPTVRDVAPAFAVLVLLVAAPLGFVGWLWSVLEWGGLVLGLLVVGGVTVVLVRWRRAVARRRSGFYTAEELARLDHDGLAEAVGWMLRRDGWRVRSEPWQGKPRLFARDRGGRRLDVTLRTDEAAAEDTPAPAPLRRVGTAGYFGMWQLIVSRGSYSRTDVLWSSRQGGCLLLDGRQLQAWAAGTALNDLVGLPPVPPGQAPPGRMTG